MEVTVGLSSRSIGLQRREWDFSRCLVERKRVPALSLSVRSWNGAPIRMNNDYTHPKHKVYCSTKRTGGDYLA